MDMTTLLVLIFAIACAFEYGGNAPVILIIWVFYWFIVISMLLTLGISCLKYFIFGVEFTPEELSSMNTMCLLTFILVIVWVYLYWWIHKKKTPVAVTTTVYFETRETQQKNIFARDRYNKKIFNVTGNTKIRLWLSFNTKNYNYTATNLLDTYTCVSETIRILSKWTNPNGTVSYRYVYDLTNVIFLTKIEYIRMQFTNSNFIIRINKAQYSVYDPSDPASDTIKFFPSHDYILHPTSPILRIYNRQLLRSGTLRCDNLLVEIRDSLGMDKFGEGVYYLTLTISFSVH
jgi:hypothetical protein